MGDAPPLTHWSKTGCCCREAAGTASACGGVGPIALMMLRRRRRARREGGERVLDIGLVGAFEIYWLEANWPEVAGDDATEVCESMKSEEGERQLILL